MCSFRFFEFLITLLHSGHETASNHFELGSWSPAEDDRCYVVLKTNLKVGRQVHVEIEFSARI